MLLNYVFFKKKSVLKWVGLLFIFAVLTLVLGCSGPYGSLKSSDEVTRFFTQNNYDPGYTYYYSGRENLPTAIIGIKPDYELVPDFWTRISPNTEMFKKIVRRIYPHSRYFPYGYDMLGPAGQKVGILFSKHRRVAIRLEADHKVQVLIHESTSSFQYGMW